jgi:group I intron endonuclease
MIDQSGIYQIVHIETGRRYVGQAKNIKRRWSQHVRALSRGKHTSSHLQRAWDKYGIEAFAFHVIELCQLELLDDCEQFHLDARSEFNVLKLARSPRGVKRSQETCDAISRALSGKPKSAEHRANLSAANIGKVQSPETRAKKSATQKGRPHSPEHRAKLAAINRSRIGYRHTAETIAKIRAARVSKSD